ncbi:MAG: caspase domain-containing protein, partial [Rhodomicrobium sp.]
HLNRPDIVARAIQLASAEAAVKEARDAGFKIADLLTRPVPRLRIVSPSANASVRRGHARVTVELEATPDPVKLIRINVNGRLVASKLPEKDGFKPGRLAFDIPLAGGADTIAIAAENSTGETVAALSLTHEGKGDLDKPGTLYILSIGVDKYPNLPGKDLNYAGADAKAFAEAMEKRSGALHRQVIKRLLVNGGTAADAPSAANIRDAFTMLRQTRENDTVMLFVSGHGINEGPDYQFAPTDAAWGSGTLLQQSSVVPWHAFAEALTGANGRRIVFLDTCHAGNAFNRRFLSDGYEANITFYSSAGPDQDAQEDSRLGGGHGLFTYALVEGVNGAARDGAGEVHADGLRDFLRVRVGELAAKLSAAQEPQYFRARDAENYVLARSP